MSATRIGPEDVRRVAKTARIKLEEAEVQRLAEDLSQMLGRFEPLRNLDTEGVEPTIHAAPLRNVLREDQVRPSLPREQVLQNAPEVQDGYFKVPRVMEEE